MGKDQRIGLGQTGQMVNHRAGSHVERSQGLQVGQGSKGGDDDLAPFEVERFERSELAQLLHRRWLGRRLAHELHVKGSEDGELRQQRLRIERHVGPRHRQGHLDPRRHGGEPLQGLVPPEEGKRGDSLCDGFAEFGLACLVADLEPDQLARPTTHAAVEPRRLPLEGQVRAPAIQAVEAWPVWRPSYVEPFAGEEDRPVVVLPPCRCRPHRHSRGPGVIFLLFRSHRGVAARKRTGQKQP